MFSRFKHFPANVTFLLHTWIKPHCIHGPHFHYLFSSGWLSRLTSFLAAVRKASESYYRKWHPLGICTRGPTVFIKETFSHCMPFGPFGIYVLTVSIEFCSKDFFSSIEHMLSLWQYHAILFIIGFFKSYFKAKEYCLQFFCFAILLWLYTNLRIYFSMHYKNVIGLWWGLDPR